MDRLQELSAQWLEAKAREAKAVEDRRRIEDTIGAALAIDEKTERTTTARFGDFEVKVACRLNRKIDADMLQEIARENGLSEHLGSLFRWKPEINAKQWKAAAPDITQPLEAAITTTAGRPSYTITKKEG